MQNDGIKFELSCRLMFILQVKLHWMSFQSTYCPIERWIFPSLFAFYKWKIAMSRDSLYALCLEWGKILSSFNDENKIVRPQKSLMAINYVTKRCSSSATFSMFSQIHFMFWISRTFRFNFHRNYCRLIFVDIETRK